MLTKKQQILRKRLLTRIHVTHQCKHLKSIDAWEDFLFHRFEVTSCKNLSINELMKLVDELTQGVSFVKHKPDFEARALVQSDKATKKQLNCIRALWNKKSKTKDDVSLLKFCKKVIKKQYLHLYNLSGEEATKIIYVLEKKL